MHRLLFSLFNPRRTLFWKLLVALGCALRIWSIMIFRSPMDLIYSDTARHWDNAKNFLNPGPMGSSNAYFYQLWLWAARQLTHDSRLALGLMATGLSVGSVLLWYLFARSVLRNKRNALIFAVVLCVLPTHIIMYQFFMPESVLVPLTGGALWLTVRASRGRRPWSFLLGVVFWISAILAKATALPMGILAVSWTWWRQTRRRIVLALVAALITSVGFGAASLHAYKGLGRYTPFGDGTNVAIYFVSGARDYQVTWRAATGGGQYTFIFSSPSFYVSPFHPRPFKTSRVGMVKFSLDPVKHGADVQESLRRELKKNWRKLPRLVYENFIFLSFGHCWPMAGFDGGWGTICIWERLIWLPIILVSTIGCLHGLWRRRSFFPIVALLMTAGLYAAQVTVMEGRYRKFIEPIVLLGVFWSIELWAYLLRTRTRSSAAKPPKPPAQVPLAANLGGDQSERSSPLA